MNTKKKYFLSTMLLVLLLLLVTIGYAYLSTNLTINGSSKINATSWNVYWDNLSVTSGSVSGSKVTTPAHILTGNTEVEFSIELNTPGDFYEFTVDAVNSGSIDAMISSLTNSVYESDGTTQKELPEIIKYTVTYNDGIPVAHFQTLNSNTTEKIKIRVEFDKNDVVASQLPNTEETLIFKIGVTYTQKDSTALPVRDGYLYSWDPVQIGSPMPSNINTYQSPPIITMSQFYLRHYIKNNIVSDSFVVFLHERREFFLRGAGATYNSATNTYNNDSPYYNANKELLLNIIGRDKCNIDISCGDNCISTQCTDYGTLFTIKSNGEVHGGWIAEECNVQPDGSSYCVAYI